MNRALADGYKAPSQIARVVTEAWFEQQMYCPACPSPRLKKAQNNTKVLDFVCERCGAEFQLKGKAGTLGRKLRDAAYEPMRQRLEENRSPNFAFLLYSPVEWTVTALLLVPGHFLTLSAIEPCRPLSPSARRAGWVGCNILTGALPDDGKVFAVAEGYPSNPAKVREKWRRFVWLSERPLETRQWTSEVLRCVERLSQRRFTLDQVYGFENELSELHPKNQNVRAKIRQQLQVLRDEGVLRFLGRGNYERT